MMRLILYSMMVLLSSCDTETDKGKGPLGLTSGEPIGSKTTMANKAVELIGGVAHVCALLEDDHATCWGLNDEKQCDMTAARNVRKTIHDISNAKFSKLTASLSYSCGIVKEEPYKDIAFCFGKEGPWLDVPHEPLNDISAGNDFVCFIRQNGTLGCVGGEIELLIIVGTDAKIKKIKAAELPKHGTDPVSKQMDQDFSQKKFKSVKVARAKVCAQGAEDGIVYCMGSNIRGGGESYPAEVLDYEAGSPHATPLILKDGTLTHVGAGYMPHPAKNMPDQFKLKYKKILVPDGIMLLTASGNFYNDGAVMPENTLVTFNEFYEEGVLGAVEVAGSFSRKRVSVYCILKDNQKIKCTSVSGAATALTNEIPKEISY